MSYEAVTRALALALDARSTGPLNLVVVDGIPGGGKSSLTAQLAAQLELLGRPAVTIENDWFIARSIRNPFSIALGLGFALSSASPARVERSLLSSFLDQSRVAAFKRELQRAGHQLEHTEAVTLRPHGAFWNLHTPPPWTSVEASNGLVLHRGGLVLIEGTLTTAVYRPEFPDLASIYVNVPPAIARARFLDRNRTKQRRRNRAFTALARSALAFRLAADLITRDQTAFDYEVDLTHLDSPTLHP